MRIDAAKNGTNSLNSKARNSDAPIAHTASSLVPQDYRNPPIWPLYKRARMQEALNDPSKLLLQKLYNMHVVA